MTPSQITATTISVFLLVMSAIAKISKPKKIVEEFIKINLEKYLVMLGALELIITVIYVIPTTMNIGFFLVCSYFGGAIAVHLGKDKPIRQIMILVVIWICMYFRNPSVFGL